jgi:hypothetical protein
MMNCNPETVSTDYDTSNRLYFEPITVEDVLNVIEVERPEGIIVQVGWSAGTAQQSVIKSINWHQLLGNLPLVCASQRCVDSAGPAKTCSTLPAAPHLLSLRVLRGKCFTCCRLQPPPPPV